jgi:hypothetical protein
MQDEALVHEMESKLFNVVGEFGLGTYVHNPWLTLAAGVTAAAVAMPLTIAPPTIIAPRRARWNRYVLPVGYTAMTPPLPADDTDSSLIHGTPVSEQVPWAQDLRLTVALRSSACRHP